MLQKVFKSGIRLVHSKRGITKANFFAHALPVLLTVAFLVTAALHMAGVVDLKQVGKQAKYMLDPPDDSPDAEPMKLTDGMVGSPYREDTLNQIPGQMRAKGVCTTRCKFSIEEFILPAGLKFNKNDLSISGVPIQEGTWIFDLCYEDAGGKDCFSPEFSITIGPKKKEPSPYRGECPTKPNPPCGSKEDNDELSPTAVGTITYDYCKCPEGTHPEGEDNISPGGPYIICMCD